MATVYLAYDLKHDRKVAVKVLKPGLAAVVGTHPMFGPSIRSFEGQRVALCRGRGGEWYEGLDEIGGLREAATRLVEGGSPERLASAIELILEGLHLSNRLNKTTSESGARYTRS